LSVRARHGDEAIRLAREARPIAVTLDLVLPGIDGWEVLKTLKSDAATRDIPVVIISRVDERDLGVALGAVDYFVITVDRARLLKDHPTTARIPILVLTSKEISADDRKELQSKVAACVQKGKSARDQLVAEIRRLRRASA